MHRCRANAAHIGQSGPDSGLGFYVKIIKTFEVVTSSLGSDHPTGVPLTINLCLGPYVGPSEVGISQDPVRWAFLECPPL